MKLNLREEMYDLVEEIKKSNPMAGSITNTVTIELVANAQLAVGGSAAMVYLPDEAEGLAEMGKASYINVGTLEPIYMETLPAMVRRLSELNRPWVLDPVAVGLGEMRTKLLLDMKEFKPSIVRGNASEIIALAGLWDLDGGVEESRVRGVDSTNSVTEAESAAISIAKYTGGAVAVSGEVDFITDGEYKCKSYGGSHFMEKITGAGCSLGGVMAVYLTHGRPFIAALAGASAYNLAGGRAQRKADGPGTFVAHFIDELYRLTADDISNNRFILERVGVEHDCIGGDCDLKGWDTDYTPDLKNLDI